MINAVYWAEMMYQGVHEEQENYREFSQKPKEERERKHDKIRQIWKSGKILGCGFSGSMMIVNGGIPVVW